MLAALSTRRMSAVEYRVPSFFEANIAQNFRLERLQRGRFPPQLRLHSHDLLLEFVHFRIGQKSRRRRGPDATNGATFRLQRTLLRRTVTDALLFRGGGRRRLSFRVFVLAVVVAVVVVVVIVVIVAVAPSFGGCGRGIRPFVESKLISVWIQFYKHLSDGRDKGKEEGRPLVLKDSAYAGSTFGPGPRAPRLGGPST